MSNTPSTTDLSLQQLREALSIREQIDKLESRLNQILGTGSVTSALPEATPRQDGRKGRRMSAAGRARIAAAARARWAKARAQSGAPSAVKSPKPAKPAGSRRRVISPEGRARIAAAQRARWAAVKRAAKRK
jgi:hypothetical protein